MGKSTKRRNNGIHRAIKIKYYMFLEVPKALYLDNYRILLTFNNGDTFMENSA
jgi:hypothetical protein